MKSVLLHIHADDGQEARLQAAVDVVRFKGGHLTCLDATPYNAFVAADPFGGVYYVPDVLDRLREQEAAQREKVEGRLSREGISWDWLHYDGDAARSIVYQARLTDLIVLSRAVHIARGFEPLPLVADVALHSRTPVLVVPDEHRALDLSAPALVAWNGSAEAAVALRASLPLLASAAEVHVVSAEEDTTQFPMTDACLYLARHGIRAELHQRTRAGFNVTDILVDAAREFRAAYLVMGAYGHSRLREYVLGGVTRQMLADSPVPLLLAH